MPGEKEAYKQFDVSQLIHSTSTPPPSLTDSQPSTNVSDDYRPKNVYRSCRRTDLEAEDEASFKSHGATYNLEQYFNLIQAMFLGKSGNFLTLHSLLRTCLDLSLAHSLQMKGSQRRDLSLKNLSVHEAHYKNHTHQIIVLDSVNIKPFSNKVYGFTRHFKTELCLQFSLALYLFARFHVPDEEGKIDLSTEILNDPHFLKAKLMNGGQKFRALSYSQQYKAWSKVSKDMGDFAPSILSRIVASKYNDNPALGCVGARKFLQRSLSLPIRNGDLELICQQAGFESASSYHLARAKIEPPLEIVREIFPFVDPKCATSMRNPLFKVLHVLRVSLIQDMVDMKANHPKEFISTHPLFESRAFYEYFCHVRKEIFIPPIIASNERSYWDAASHRQLGPAALPTHIINKEPQIVNHNLPPESIRRPSLFDPKPTLGRDIIKYTPCPNISECMQEIRGPINRRLERLENMIEDILQAMSVIEMKIGSLNLGRDEEHQDSQNLSSDNTPRPI